MRVRLHDVRAAASSSCAVDAQIAAPRRSRQHGIFGVGLHRHRPGDRSRRPRQRQRVVRRTVRARDQGPARHGQRYARDSGELRLLLVVGAGF